LLAEVGFDDLGTEAHLVAKVVVGRCPT